MDQASRRFIEPDVEMPKPPPNRWTDYFQKLKDDGHINQGHKAEEVSQTEEDVSFSHVTVTVPGHEVFEGWPNTLQTWRKRLLDAEWLVKMGFAQAHHDTTYYKNGNVNAEEHDEETWWINALKGGKYVTISYTYAPKKDKMTNIFTARQVRGVNRNLSDKEMQEAVNA